MAKLDRLGWAAGIGFMSHGLRVGIRVNNPAVLERIPEHLPPKSDPVTSPIVDVLYSLILGGDSTNSRVRRFHLLYIGAGQLARTMKLAELFDTLESDLHLRVATMAHHLFVHAGVVSWQRRAILIPGHSGSGKTTLVRELVKAGAMYYSDEFAVLDGRGRVHPYAKPLYLRGAEGERRQKVPVQALGGRTGTKPLTVGLVALTTYQMGARWRPQVLSPGEGVLELLGNTLLARHRPRQALQTLGQIAASAVILKGKRGEAKDVSDALLNRCAEQALAPSARAGLITTLG